MKRFLFVLALLALPTQAQADAQSDLQLRLLGTAESLKPLGSISYENFSYENI